MPYKCSYWKMARSNTWKTPTNPLLLLFFTYKGLCRGDS